MPRLTDILTIARGETVAIVGSGGKTSLMWLLAKHYRQSTVLVATTTKIGLPEASCFDTFVEAKDFAAAPVAPGITLAGEKITGGDFVKLSALDPADLQAAGKRYDRVLVEGDGSKNLPLKGWSDYEPVVPADTACTIGIIPVWPIGLPADETLVHRLALFCRISGCVPGETLTAEHLAAAVSHPEGLFKGSAGRRILLINQVEDPAAKQEASRLVEALDKDFLQSLDMVVSGSVLRDAVEVLWANTHAEAQKEGLR